jgi:hypothetical protein
MSESTDNIIVMWGSPNEVFESVVRSTDADAALSAKFSVYPTGTNNQLLVTRAPDNKSPVSPTPVTITLKLHLGP